MKNHDKDKDKYVIIIVLNNKSVYGKIKIIKFAVNTCKNVNFAWKYAFWTLIIEAED